MPGPRRPRPTAGGEPRVLNVVASPDDVWDAIEHGRLADTDPPPAVDLTAGRPWYRVNDQGRTGSCMGWALADSVMRWQLVSAGRLGERQHLSARFVWMASKEWQAQRVGRGHGDADDLTALLERWQPSTFLEEAPTAAKDGLEVARHLGVAPASLLRWTGPLNRGPEPHFWLRARQYKLEAYYSVSDPALDARLRRWRQWIAQHGPVMIVVATDRSLLAGEPVLRKFIPRRRTDLHACALVGYDADGFILRNSWGARWGRNGYARATPDWLRQAVRESYGVVFPP